MKPNSLCSIESNTRAIALCFVLSSISVILRAQEAPPQAGFRFANASAIPGKVLFTIDNTKLRPDGFGPGQNTGAIGILAGNHRLIASTAGVKPAETSLMLQANTATTIIAFTKLVVDPITHQSVQQLQLLSQVDPAREKGKHFYLLYASGRPSIDLAVNGQPRNLTSLRALRVDDVARGSIKIERGGKPILEFSAEESGTFLIVVFDKPDGTLGGMLLPDYG